MIVTNSDAENLRFAKEAYIEDYGEAPDFFTVGPEMYKRLLPFMVKNENLAMMTFEGIPVKVSDLPDGRAYAESSAPVTYEKLKSRKE